MDVKLEGLKFNGLTYENNILRSKRILQITEEYRVDGTSALCADLQYNANDYLKFAMENGMVDLSGIQEKMIMAKKKELLKKHPYKVWRGTDGKWRTYFPDETKPQNRRMVKKKTEAEIQDVIVEYWKEELENPTVREVYHEWIQQKVEYGDIQKGSADRYDTDFIRFFEKSGFAKKRIKEVGERELKDFIRRQISANKLTAKAYAGMRILVRGIWIYAKENNWTDISISAFFGDLSISRNAFRKVVKDEEELMFRDGEVAEIAAYVRENKNIWNLGILLVFQTGLRVGELSALKREDWRGNKLMIRRTEVKQKDENGRATVFVREFTKTESGMRELYLSDCGIETLEEIVKINPDGEYLFENSRGKRIRGNTFNKRFSAIQEELEQRHRSIHKARGDYGTRMIDAGCDESLVMRQMGHSSIETTKKYYYYSNKTAARQMEQIQKAIQI